MKKLLLTLSFLGNLIYAQNNSFNFDFEDFDTMTNLPKNWSIWGYSYINHVDDAYSGKKAIQLASKENVDFGSIVYSIPNQYQGKKIRLEGYIKTENVETFAGLIIRQDGSEGTPINFVNSQNTPAIGTTNWTKYSIESDLNPETRTIQIAIILAGKGSATFDHLNVFIDDVNMQSIKVDNYKNDPYYKDSGIQNIRLNDQIFENLEILGRIWGFLKYYHPTIASGKYNWDYELFKFIPQYLLARSIKDRDTALLNWIKSYGQIKKCNNCNTDSKNTNYTVDHSWISNYELNENLQKELFHIYENRLTKKNHYVSLASGVGNPVFPSENSYTGFSYHDQGYHLLTLFKYWNAINYFFPHKSLTDKKWEDVLKEFIPKYLNITNELEFEKTTIELFSNINDSHAFVMEGDDKLKQENGRNMIPLDVKFIDHKLIVTDIRKLNNQNIEIKVGDEITKINGKTITELVQQFNPQIRASNMDGKYRQLASMLLHTKEEKVNLEINQKNIIINSISLSDYYQKDDLKSYKLLTKDIGYINLEYIKSADIKEIPKELFQTKGIIIDIRNYPNDNIFMELSQIFSDEIKPFSKSLIPNLENIGEFIFTKNEQTIRRSNYNYKGKIIVLVNEETQSNAEYTTMALQATGKTTVVGSNTAGADGNISFIILPGGFKTSFTGLGIYYPDGKETQRIGLVPDVYVKPTIKGVKEGKDEVLEKAIQLIEQ